MKIRITWENIMDVKKRNRIIGIFVFFLALIIVLTVVPIFIKLSSHYYTILFYAVGLGCLYLNIFVLIVALFIVIYYIIRSRKSLKRKKTLSIIEMIFGCVIIVLSLIGIGFLLHGFLDWVVLGSLPTILITLVIPLLVLAIPGILLLVHARYIRNVLKSENIS
jgi:MFS family permease